MSILAPDVSKYRTYRYVTTGDTLLTSYKPSNHPNALGTRVITCNEEAVAVVPLLRDAAGETAILHFIAWMAGGGPGIYLGQVTCTAGAMAIDEPPVAASDQFYGEWPAGVSFLNCDALAVANPAPGTSINTLVSTGSDLTGLLRVGLFGCNMLQIEVNLNSSAAAVGLLWRPLSGTFK